MNKAIDTIILPHVLTLMEENMRKVKCWENPKLT